MKAELARRIKTKEEAKAFLNACQGASFAIDDITTRPIKKTPPAPFTTSTLQQEAARKLGYTVAQTMMLAQRLYESGFITYMRTDSVNLSEFATAGSKDAIIKMMGDRYVHPRHFETKTKGAQEAHEAIRPTYIENQSVEGTAQEKKLYDLIWKRTIASQMADAELEKTTATITISGSSDVFTAIGEVIKFDGFLRVYRESYDDDNEQEDESHLLPPLKKKVRSWNTALSSQPNVSPNALHAIRKQVLYASWKNWASAAHLRMHLPSLPSNNANMWRKVIKTGKNVSLMS